jgi:hypothetical protein
MEYPKSYLFQNTLSEVDQNKTIRRHGLCKRNCRISFMTDPSDKGKYFAATRYSASHDKRKADEPCEFESTKRLMVSFDSAYVPPERLSRLLGYNSGDETDSLQAEEDDAFGTDTAAIFDSGIIESQYKSVGTQFPDIECLDTDSEEDSITLSESSSHYSYPSEEHADFELNEDEHDLSDAEYESDPYDVHYADDEFYAEGDDAFDDDDDYGLADDIPPAPQPEVIVIYEDDDELQVGVQHARVSST